MGSHMPSHLIHAMGQILCWIFAPPDYFRSLCFLFPFTCYRSGLSVCLGNLLEGPQHSVSQSICSKTVINSTFEKTAVGHSFIPQEGPHSWFPSVLAEKLLHYPLSSFPVFVFSAPQSWAPLSFWAVMMGPCVIQTNVSWMNLPCPGLWT
jgi:hypothetical protein